MLTAFVPLALLPLPVALLVCGAAAGRAPGAARIATLALAALGALLVFFFLVGGAVAGLVQLPLGLPGIGISLGLDGLSGFFLLPVLLAGGAAALFGLGRARPDAAPGAAPDAAAVPVLLAGLVFTLLAADGFAALLGLGVAGLGLAGLQRGGLQLGGPLAPAPGETDPAALRPLGVFILAFACLAAVFGLLAPATGGIVDLRFAAMRAVAMAGTWRALAVLVLTLAFAAALIGLAPFQSWLPEAAGRAAGPGAALAGSAAPLLGLYLLVRVLLALCGPMLPGWWGWPLVLLGGVSAVLAMLRANLGAELRPVLAAGGMAQFGVAVIGVGIALVARAADLPPLAALALGAALLQGFATALAQTVLLLVAVSAEVGAGTRRLDRLGGLIRGMRVTTGCALVGAASLAALPPAAGFAGLWLVVQAAVGTLRVGGIGGEMALALAVAAIGLTAALGAAAAVRLIGIGFLGRPRSPRGAAADEAAGPARIAMVGGAALLVLLGLLPGPALGLAAPALHLLLGVQEAGPAGAALLVPLAGMPPYSAIGLAGLLLLATIAVIWAGGRWTVQTGRDGPAWESGFAAPPAWLPFGDPLTELGPAGFAGELGRIFKSVRPGRLARWGERLAAAGPRLAGWADRAGSGAGGAVPSALAVLALLLLAAWLAGA